MADFQTARRPLATAEPLGSCRSSTSVPTVPISRTELQSSLLHGISAGRGVGVVVGGAADSPYCAEHRRRRPRVTGGGQRSREEERRRRGWSAGLGFRVLSGEATARTAMAIFLGFCLSLPETSWAYFSVAYWRGCLFTHCKWSQNLRRRWLTRRPHEILSRWPHFAFLQEAHLAVPVLSSQSHRSQTICYSLTGNTTVTDVCKTAWCSRLASYGQTRYFFTEKLFFLGTNYEQQYRYLARWSK